jgi:HK97 family phage portal protein
MIGRLLKRSAETRSGVVQLPGRTPLPQPLTGPMSVNRDTLLSYVTAQRCVQMISDQIGTLPLYSTRAGERIATPPLLAEPEMGRTRSEFMAAATVSLLINGNMYALIAGRDGLGFPIKILLLDPEAVSVRLVDGRLVYKAGQTVIDQSELLHIRGFTLPGAFVGVGPLGYNRQAIAQALAGDQYAAGMFTEASLPDGVLHSENEVTSDQAAQLKQAFIAGNGGRQRGPAVLSGGVKYQPLEFSSVDQELLDSRRFSQLQVCSLFGVPPHLVGVPSSDSNTYSSVTQDTAAFVKFTLRPWLTRLEEGFSTLLPQGDRARFNLDALLRASTLERYQAHAAGIAAGFLTTAEVREMEDLPELPPDSVDARNLAEMVQKIYLGVGTVITSAEARQLLNDAGGTFPIPGPPMGGRPMSASSSGGRDPNTGAD